MSTGGKRSCSNCGKDSFLVLVKCVECPNTFICPPCFAQGSQFNSHLKSHSYKVIDSGSFPIIENDWSALEEKALLDGIEQFGIGNWGDMTSCTVGKVSHDLEQHYYKSYIDSSDLGYLTMPKVIPNRVTDHTPSLHDSWYAMPLQRPDINTDQESQLAYMPYRDDYEMEHDNDAESVISDLTINADDSELETNLKTAQVHIYLDKLKERHRRKCIAREYHLVERFYNKHSIEYPKQILSCLQYMNEKQAIMFSRGYRREQILKRKIKHLKMYRKYGVKKFEDGISLDVKQRRRAKAKLASKSLDSVQNEKLSDKFSTEHGNHLLSDEEKILCKTLKMLPSSYLTTKILIIKEYIQKQEGVGIKVRFPSFLEKSQRKKIASFLLLHGWLPKSSS